MATEGLDVLRAAIVRAGEVGGHGISPEQQVELLDRQQAAEKVHDDLAAVCDAYGLPHSAVALDRHLTGNSGLTIEVWKLNASERLAERDEAYDLLADLVGDHCSSHLEPEDGCSTCAAVALLAARPKPVDDGVAQVLRIVRGVQAAAEDLGKSDG